MKYLEYMKNRDIKIIKSKSPRTIILNYRHKKEIKNNYEVDF
jgi:hypothetical protein